MSQSRQRVTKGMTVKQVKENMSSMKNTRLIKEERYKTGETTLCYTDDKTKIVYYFDALGRYICGQQKTLPIESKKTLKVVQDTEYRV